MISELLESSFVDLNFNVADKNAAIDKLSDLLCESGKITDKDNFCNAVFEREKLGTTGIGAGIAIPHARTNTVNEVSIAFARSTKGIDFNAVDGNPVNLFFVLAAPVESGSAYLKLLARISRLLRYQDLIDDLKKAKTKEEVIQLIASRE